MASKILSVSCFADIYRCMEIERQSGGFQAQLPVTTMDEQAVIAMCRKADEIYINADWPSTSYRWQTLPKVAKRYQANLVRQDARERLGGEASLQVQWKILDDVTEGGVTKSRVFYAAVPDQETAFIRDLASHFTRKVRIIAPLPLALASLVAGMEKPADNFSVVWVGEKVILVNNQLFGRAGQGGTYRPPWACLRARPPRIRTNCAGFPRNSVVKCS